ncbi:hypothetical protein [Polymorphobacter fuscus]|uniref:Uncharacterized protein n=1 Tax=Sandarakinorhabdus fusca TaxID=1439888 RepID=A0A7C9GQP0_9SPHN|nr:hypothetical protein [Polymorphobacter fuscus]KAB7644470.1 hypothetical protein F9290_14170 [Polymorphobacter fuscus]MQT18397.1 hypothetical protein [Polymorphobacter fuscus]NJC08297.1 hypothetical protein [Polymorphobacter fuscus]
MADREGLRLPAMSLPKSPPAVLRRKTHRKTRRAETPDRPLRNGERMRLGLTGLGAIFLIVMIVAAGLRPPPRPAAQDPQGESLAVLGVAPGASTPPVGTAAKP